MDRSNKTGILNILRFHSAWKRMNSGLAGAFAAVIIGVFPLVFRDFYFDILNFKTYFYYWVVISFAAMFLVVNAAFLILSIYLGCLRNPARGRRIDASDWSMLDFILIAGISTLQSVYPAAALLGSEGRFSGLLMWIAYAFMYFVVSKNLRLRQWYLDLFLAAGMAACAIGILLYFDIDPIGFRTLMEPAQYYMFTSTIGNINAYTSYAALLSGASTLLFFVEESRIRKKWYLFCMSVSFFALITGMSDNAYLAILALIGLLPLYAFKNLKGVRTYTFILAVLMSEFWILQRLLSPHSDAAGRMGGLYRVISGSHYLIVLVAALWVIYVVLRRIVQKLPDAHPLMRDWNRGRWLWLAFLAAGVILTGFALYDVNVRGNAGNYGGLAQYLAINDDWGTHRWYIWRIGLERYSGFSITQKLFGTGPDTYGLVVMENDYDEMVRRYGEFFDSAHNEYLQYLVTVGLAGLAAYLALLATSVCKMVRSAGKRPYVMAIAFAIICYAAQAAVNISVPIVTPVMLMLLAMGVSGEDGAA
ncbi:O-antigen ligase family protein [Enterocloster lavalensis]|nr:O-antigen ligase family protein [Enterocloster lavalensis]PST34851.1 hypothetical protein C7256_03075 [Enterocloster lavalensis]